MFVDNVNVVLPVNEPPSEIDVELSDVDTKLPDVNVVSSMDTSIATGDTAPDAPTTVIVHNVLSDDPNILSASSHVRSTEKSVLSTISSKIRSNAKLPTSVPIQYTKKQQIPTKNKLWVPCEHN